MVASAITEDTSRHVIELVEAGWPVGDARTAAGSWWSTTCAEAIRNGLNEGDRRARAAA